MSIILNVNFRKLQVRGWRWRATRIFLCTSIKKTHSFLIFSSLAFYISKMNRCNTICKIVHIYWSLIPLNLVSFLMRKTISNRLWKLMTRYTVVHTQISSLNDYFRCKFFYSLFCVTPCLSSPVKDIFFYRIVVTIQ